MESLQTCVIDFLLSCRASGLASKTVVWYSGILETFASFDTELPWWTAGAVRCFLADLQSRPPYRHHPSHPQMPGTLSIATLRGYHRALRRFFSWLQAEGRLEVNPMERIKAPRAPHQVPKGITHGDCLALLAATEDDPRSRALLLLLADSGARASEVCNLHLDDLNLEQGIALVHGKGSKDRNVFLSPPTVQAIADWLAVRSPSLDGWLFPGQRGPLKPSGMAQVLKRLKKETGIKGKCNPHSFRHGFARDYLLAGGDLASLCELLGHSDIAVTKGYAIFSRRELQAQHLQYSPVARLLAAV